jgi:tetratricopeptide (TPR) repeat protein
MNIRDVNRMKKPVIFLSYCHDDKAEIDELEKTFDYVGVQLKRDIRKLNYKDSLDEYMNTAHDDDYLLAFISEDFFKSENCAHELCSVIGKKNMILPVVKNQETYSQLDEILIGKHWSKIFKELTDKITKIEDPTMSNQLQPKLIKIQNIKNNIVPVVQFIKDSFSKTFEDLNKEGFKTIFEFIKLPQYTEMESIHVSTPVEDQKRKSDNKELNEIENLLLATTDIKIIIDRKYRKAVLLSEYGDYKKAIQVYEEILKIVEPKSIDEYAVLSNYTNTFMDYIDVYKGKHNIQKLKNILEYMLKVFPREPKTNAIYAGFMNNYFDEYGISKKHFEIELSSYPRNIGALVDYAQLLYIKFNNPELARIKLEEAMEYEPNDKFIKVAYITLLVNSFLSFNDEIKYVSDYFDNLISTMDENDLLLKMSLFSSYGLFLRDQVGDMKNSKMYLNQSNNLAKRLGIKQV